MATVPIYNPQSPFLGRISGGLRNGSTVKIRVQIQGFSNRCQINFQSGAALQPRDDVMLHLSIRPQENCIVRNHFKNQTWGAEERHGGNPVQAHQSFEVSVTAEPTQYRISINGQHFCTFVHRLPMNLVQFVSISGTCTISHILIDQSGPSIGFPPMQVHPIHPRHPPVHPIHPRHPPVHHHPPAPPPMPHYPPPYPGHYPGHHHPTPYTTPEKDDKTSIKVAAAVGAGVGLTAVALSRAARRMNKKN